MGNSGDYSGFHKTIHGKTIRTESAVTPFVTVLAFDAHKGIGDRFESLPGNLLPATHTDAVATIPDSGQGRINKSQSFDLLLVQSLEGFSIDIVSGNIREILGVHIIDESLEIFTLGNKGTYYLFLHFD